MNAESIVQIVGIYDADAGPVGETRYVLGKLLGRTHCALCDITHSPVRRKSAWDQMVDTLGLPFQLLHRNEIPADLAHVTDLHALPLVIGRTTQGAVLLLSAEQLEQSDSSVAAFERGLRQALRRHVGFDPQATPGGTTSEHAGSAIRSLR